MPAPRFLQALANAWRRLFQPVRMRPEDFGEIELMVQRGHSAAAVESYRVRAKKPGSRVEATLRIATLLAGPMNQPERAAKELEWLKTHPPPLSQSDDVRVGIALADLYFRPLDDPDRAMRELQRLADAYQAIRHGPMLRSRMASARAEQIRRQESPGPDA